MFQFFKRSHEKEEGYLFFLKNGSMLLEGLASTSNFRYDIPYRNFTAKEIIGATNNFRELVMYDGTGSFFRGSFGDRPILVKRYVLRKEQFPINNDIVMSLMMCHHKNVLKLLGCCLYFSEPVLVYECSGDGKILRDILYTDKEHISKKVARSLSWKNRLKVATDVGNALVYLHTTFATPIIHRSLNARNIVIDQSGVAKLLDFSLCIALPPGETQVADSVVGVSSYLDPEYMTTGIITEKTDVYMFGVLLLILVTGEKRPIAAEFSYVVDYVKDRVEKHCLNEALDGLILEEKGEEPIEQQLQAFVELALRCCQPKGKDRPHMIDVAKELSRIESSGRCGKHS